MYSTHSFIEPILASDLRSCQVGSAQRTCRTISLQTAHTASNDPSSSSRRSSSRWIELAVAIADEDGIQLILRLLKRRKANQAENRGSGRLLSANSGKMRMRLEMAKGERVGEGEEEEDDEEGKLHNLIQHSELLQGTKCGQRTRSCGRGRGSGSVGYVLSLYFWAQVSNPSPYTKPHKRQSWVHSSFFGVHSFSAPLQSRFFRSTPALHCQKRSGENPLLRYALPKRNTRVGEYLRYNI